MIRMMNDDEILNDTIEFVRKGFIKGLWSGRKKDIDHIFKGFNNFKHQRNGRSKKQQ